MVKARCVGFIRVDIWVSSVAPDGPDSSELIGPVENFSLFSNPECIVFTKAASINECLELLESSVRTAVEPGYNPWSYWIFRIKFRI